MSDLVLVTLDPAHFHAALVQKAMIPGLARRAHVYAPLGSDLLAHLGRIAGFNARDTQATAWEVEVHAGPDFLARALRERPGQVAVLAGRNRTKIDTILALVDAGFHVLADKPWVLREADLPKVRLALDLAAGKGLAAYDIMTERFEVTSILQRELVNDPDVFGDPVPGTPEDPAVRMESVHSLLKDVAGIPLRRPETFFDGDEQGEGLTDVGPHLADLVMEILRPGRPVDADRDIRLLSARRWPTVLTRQEYTAVTGAADFAPFLHGDVRNERLHYPGNGEVFYTLDGHHVRLTARWDVRAEGVDTHFARFRGTRAVVEIRQGPEEGFRPELYVEPRARGVPAAVQARVDQLQRRVPGLGLAGTDRRIRLLIPPAARIGHEAHFAQVVRQFLDYVRDPASLPAWEAANMTAKYRVTTGAVGLARSRTATERS